MAHNCTIHYHPVEDWFSYGPGSSRTVGYLTEMKWALQSSLDQLSLRIVRNHNLALLVTGKVSDTIACSKNECVYEPILNSDTQFNNVTF